MLRIRMFAVCAALFACQARAQSSETGKAQYQARCVGCHGADGTGGGHGPAIVDVPRPRATTKPAVLELIRKGIPDRGMPAFQISDEEASAIADFVMSLKTPVKAPTTVAPPGDAAAGERFFSKNNCGSCHMLRGRGGVLGPDLSNAGRERTLAQIEQALRDPGAAGQSTAAEDGVAGPLIPRSPYISATAESFKASRRTRAILICSCLAPTKSSICCQKIKSQTSSTTNR